MGRKQKEAITVEGLRVLGPASKGRCVAKNGDKVYFIEKVSPGDLVDIRVTKKRRGVFEATPTAIHEQGPNRQEPFCQHFDSCGGCKWQHISYEGQLQMKQELVTQQLRRLGHVDLPPAAEIIASPSDRYYRNKLEYTFSQHRWLSASDLQREEELDRRAVGFHVPGRWDRVVDIDHCHLQAEPTNAIRNSLRTFAKEKGYSFYNIYQQEGLLRNLVIRTSSGGQVMAILQLGAEDPQAEKALVDFLIDKHPEISTLYTVVNLKNNETFYDQEMKLQKGPAELEEKMEELVFKVGPKSFFQTNGEQALRLYQKVRELASIQEGDLVYDLYTGTGTIALFLAKQAKQIVGVEVVPEAIADAKKNASENGIENCTFIAADLAYALSDKFVAEHGRPDVVVADPPRAGMNPQVVEALLQLKPRRVVYVSCNPSTQARDLEELSSEYKVRHLQALDMFPQTDHIENIAVLELIES